MLPNITQTCVQYDTVIASSTQITTDCYRSMDVWTMFAIEIGVVIAVIVLALHIRDRI